MRATWLIFKKELLEQFRDRRNFFLVVLLPLLLWPALLVGLDKMQANQPEEPKIAVSSAWSQDSRDQFTKATGVKTYVAKVPAKEVKDGKSPLYLDIDSNNKQIKMYVSDKNPDPLLQTQIENYVLKLNVNKQLPADKQSNWKLLIDQTPGKEDSFLSKFTGFYMLSLIIGISSLTGGMGIATDAIAGEKERGTMRSLLTLPFSSVKIWAGKWLAVSLVSLISVILSITSYLSVQPWLENMKLIDTKWILALSIPNLIGIMILLLLYIGTCAALLLMISTFAKSFKEAQGYLSPVMMLPMIITFYLAFGVQEDQLPQTYFFIPFVNIQAVLFEGANKVLTLSHTLIAIASSIVTIVVAIYLGSRIFKHPQRLLPH
ncbi:ABC transporter permease [Thermoflavimicrobium dichotomicum]|uniref:Sodium transport system permease protein n=1 Tax=Thermoflavimicrobium dichotomicum TaxID=46223 RepID=A0A1I3QUQ8_9BACL|nr:ABC transporter permease [Thermoflavimicrobium dichotomicum]SFJ37914.1 sodium transport system permease protein [Thermoflavimicrobium dichotomicum]